MTISEIAKMAGVSSAAVSRYLNNGSLSQQKRECIAKVIEETNYQPSEYARTMRTKKTKRIGVIVFCNYLVVMFIWSHIQMEMLSQSQFRILLLLNLIIQKVVLPFHYEFQ